MLRSLSNFLVTLLNRWMPDSFVVAIVLSLFTFVMAITVAGFPVADATRAWGDSIWNLLRFTNQIVLTLLLVVMVAAVVSFWPDRTPSMVVNTPVQPKAEDELLQRHFDWPTEQLRTGNFEQAINGFRAVLEQAPTMPEAWINTGFAQVELKQYEQAAQSSRARRKG